MRMPAPFTPCVARPAAGVTALREALGMTSTDDGDEAGGGAADDADVAAELEAARSFGGAGEDWDLDWLVATTSGGGGRA